MWQDAHDSYLESRVLSADPIELVRMLYQSATRGVENARRHLAAGDIGARARSISHACAVLIELTTSLDHERGGSVSTNLAQLYDYMLRRLTEANLQQTDAPLAEVLGLLATLSEGWEGVRESGSSASAPSQPAASEERTWTQVGAGAGDSSTNSESSWTGYGSSWEQPKSQDDQGEYRPWEAAALKSPTLSESAEVPTPVTPSVTPNLWERNDSDAWPPPPSPNVWEPAGAYDNSWAHLAAQEASYTQHDWSL